MSIEDQIRDTRTRIQSAQAKKARAAYEVESAQARLDQARSVLQTQFGASTLEEAQSVRADLHAKLEAALAEVDAKLREAGA